MSIKSDGKRVRRGRRSHFAEGALVYLLAVIRPSRFAFEWILSKARPISTRQKMRPILYSITRTLWLFRRGISHLWNMDFALLDGRVGIVFHKLGILEVWKKTFLRTYKEKIT